LDAPPLKGVACMTWGVGGWTGGGPIWAADDEIWGAGRTSGTSAGLGGGGR